MTTIYHVCRGDWDGRDLLPFASRHEWSDEACERILAAWPDLMTVDKAWEYFCTDGQQVHCHATLEQALDFAAEYGGSVLEIDATGLDIAEGREYPHPVVCGPIPAWRVKVIQAVLYHPSCEPTFPMGGGDTEPSAKAWAKVMASAKECAEALGLAGA